MRISDWSSDVCSSDLIRAFIIELSEQAAEIRHHVENLELVDIAFLTKLDDMVDQEGRAVLDSRRDPAQPAIQFGSVNEIGRANVLTPVTNAQLVCRLLLEKQKR